MTKGAILVRLWRRRRLRCSTKIAVTLAILAAGCAFHARLDPPAISACAFYCRVTDCPGQPIPPQLTPQAREEVTEAQPCVVTEVGAKSYSDSLTAIGVIVSSLIAAGLMF